MITCIRRPGRTANQITTLNAVNVLSPPVAANPPAYADPADTTRSLNDRARAYLHTNCANCHRPQGGTPVNIDLRHGTALVADRRLRRGAVRRRPRHRECTHHRARRRRAFGIARAHVDPQLLVGRRVQGTLDRPAERREHRGPGQRRLGAAELARCCVKHFRIGNQLVETRLFMRHPDGVWAGYTYQWNQAQTEATRVTRWRHGQCRRPDLDLPERSAVHAVPHGSSGRQPGTRNGPAERRSHLSADRAHGEPDHDAQRGQRAVAAGRRESAGLCRSFRHRPEPDGARAQPTCTRTARTATGLRAGRPASTSTCATTRRLRRPAPVTSRRRAGDLGIANARIIAPGDDARSVLLARMTRRNANMMPPIASNVVDAAGVQLIGAWIDSLTPASCQ